MENKDEITRCFIALDLPRQIINDIVRIQNLLRKQIKFRCKYTEPENLHLTLKFLGEIDSNKINEVKKSISKIKQGSFEAKLGKIGFFQTRQSYIIWVELNNRFIKELQREIDTRLRDLFNPEYRFMGHITVVRAKKIGLKDSNEMKAYLQTVRPIYKEFEVDKFFLKKSQLFETGPVYDDIEVYCLAGKESKEKI